LAERDSKTKDLINFKSQLSQTQVELNQALQGKQSLETRLNSTNPEAPDYQEIRIQLVNQTTRAAELEGKMSSLRSVIGTLDKKLQTCKRNTQKKIRNMKL
jgi:chromosome segregation ATPase